jgi:GTP:adenosylcobinamide-phosphate guanylyltransferase/tRNA A-37 threonylcarbamoyl transferase component Bud32
MNIDHIVVQAGGKGTRLEYLTANKPKAIVPVENLPILFHLFRKFPDKKYIIIADYKREVLHKYLAAFADVKYKIVNANGTGTCSGIKQATELIPDNTPFMLVWSDLILPDDFVIPTAKDNYIGISQTFPCRWKYENGEFKEERSEQCGVAGLFIFKDKVQISDIPESGELVRYIQSKQIKFCELGLAGTKEFGLFSEYEALGQEKCRPFNKITMDGDTFIKEGIGEQGHRLAALERKWYEFARVNGINNIPKIYSTEPLKMEYIRGQNIYEYNDLDIDSKREILTKIVLKLNELHAVGNVPTDLFSLKDAYFGKTIKRLSKVRNLIPFANRRTIIVNGRECHNIYFYEREFERKLDKLQCEKFTFIHGDCTFSNLMLRDDREPIFIDPRGYFGYTELYGDSNYDFAKLYYSIVGNYDRFNLKDFRLTIGEHSVELKIQSNKWEELEQDFFELTNTDKQTIKLLHAVIWLSLTTYAWQDYDSICGAFYNGIYYLEEVL